MNFHSFTHGTIGKERVATKGIQFKDLVWKVKRKLKMNRKRVGSWEISTCREEPTAPRLERERETTVSPVAAPVPGWKEGPVLWEGEPLPEKLLSGRVRGGPSELLPAPRAPHGISHRLTSAGGREMWHVGHTAHRGHLLRLRSLLHNLLHI